MNEVHYLDSILDDYFKSEYSGKKDLTPEKHEIWKQIMQNQVRAYIKNLFESADVNNLDRYTLTSFSHEIAASPRVKLIARMIRNKKLNPYLRNELGDTFLHTLALNPHLKSGDWEQIISYLNEDSRIDFNIQNKEGMNFIMLLPMSNHQKAIEILLETTFEKIDLYAKDIYGRSSFQIASEYKSYDIASSLYLAGGNKMNDLSLRNSYVAEKFRTVFLLPTSFFDLKLILDPILDTLKIKNTTRRRDTDDFLVKKIYEQYLYTALNMDRSEKIRQHFLNQTLQGDTYISLVYSALREGDSYSLNQLFPRERVIIDEYMGNYMSEKIIDPKTHKERVLYEMHALIESIRYNQPQSVEFIMGRINMKRLFKLSRQYFFFDPLATAFMTSYLIPLDDYEAIKKNTKIINMLISDARSDKPIPSEERRTYLQLSSQVAGLAPMEFAILKGLYQVVKTLHEDKGIPLPFNKKILNTDIKYSEFIRYNGPSDLEGYYNSISKKEASVAKCENAFL